MNRILIVASLVTLVISCSFVDGITCDGEGRGRCGNNALGERTTCIKGMCLPMSTTMTSSTCTHSNIDPEHPICAPGTEHFFRAQKVQRVNGVVTWLDCWEEIPMCRATCPDCKALGSNIRVPGGITRYSGSDCSSYYKDSCE